MNKKRIFLVILILAMISFLCVLSGIGLCAEQKKTTSTSGSGIQQPTPQIPSGQGVPRGPGVSIPDQPAIREFSISPYEIFLVGEPRTLIPTGTLTFRWRVEPGPGGSRITSITITKTSGNGPNLNVRSSNSTGDYSLEIPPSVSEGTTAYTLVATNEKGITSNRTVELSIRRLSARDIYIVNFALEPFLAPVGQGCDFKITIANNIRTMTLSGINIYVSGTRPDSSRSRNPYLELRDQTLRPGVNEITSRIRHGLYDGEEALIVEIEYRGEIISARRIGLERRTITAYQIAVTGR